MILDHAYRHRDVLQTQPTEAAVERSRSVLIADPLGFDVEPETYQAILCSGLFLEFCRLQGRRDFGHGATLDVINGLPPCPPSEYARLISKGRLLYEHCMMEVSHTCMIGYMHHELTKSRASLKVMLELLGWIFAQRFELVALAQPESEDASSRLAHTDYLIDQGVSFVHGLDRATALRLAAAKEP